MSDMSNMINLDIDGIQPARVSLPVPTAVYILQIDDATVAPTKKGGKQIEFKIKVADGPFSGTVIGGGGLVRLYIPSRTEQSEDKYEKTTAHFMGKIEAITGRPYANFNVRELIGLKFKGIVVLKDDGYGPQNDISHYLPLTADTAGIVIPQATVRPPAATAGNGGNEAGEAARFRI